MGDLNRHPYLYKKDIMNFDDENFGLDKNSELYRLLKMLSEKENLDNEEENSDEIQDSLEKLAQMAENTETLGPPDKKESYNDGDLTITVSYWFVPGGEIKSVDIEGDDALVSQEDLEDKIAQIIKENGDLNVIGVDINNQPYDVVPSESQLTKSMEEMLKEVVEREDYVLAAKIRDDIKNRDELINSIVAEAKEKIEDGDYDNAKILLGKAAELKKGGYHHGT